MACNILIRWHEPNAPNQRATANIAFAVNYRVKKSSQSKRNLWVYARRTCPFPQCANKSNVHIFRVKNENCARFSLEIHPFKMHLLYHLSMLTVYPTTHRWVRPRINSVYRNKGRSTAMRTWPAYWKKKRVERESEQKVSEINNFILFSKWLRCAGRGMVEMVAPVTLRIAISLLRHKNYSSWRKRRWPLYQLW